MCGCVFVCESVSVSGHIAALPLCVCEIWDDNFLVFTAKETNFKKILCLGHLLLVR